MEVLNKDYWPAIAVEEPSHRPPKNIARHTLARARQNLARPRTGRACAPNPGAPAHRNRRACEPKPWRVHAETGAQAHYLARMRTD